MGRIDSNIVCSPVRHTPVGISSDTIELLSAWQGMNFLHYVRFLHCSVLLLLLFKQRNVSSRSLSTCFHAQCHLHNIFVFSSHHTSIKSIIIVSTFEVDLKLQMARKPLAHRETNICYWCVARPYKIVFNEFFFNVYPMFCCLLGFVCIVQLRL